MLLVLLLATCAHPNSISSAAIDVKSATSVRVELRFEARTANEVLPLDTDGDGRLSTLEVQASTDSLGDYLVEHYTLTTGGAAPDEGKHLKATLASLAIDPSSPSDELGSTWLVAELDFEGALFETLWIQSSLFLKTSPDHRNFARFLGPPPIDWVFSGADPVWLIDLPSVATEIPQSTWLPWLRLGFEHILEGPDHLCFVLGLLLAAGGLRQLAFSITGFTLAHSITLGLAATGMIPAGGHWSEVLIAASIVFVGAENLRRGTPRRAWPEAFGFGLIHGLGFAAALADALQALGPHTHPLVPLFGFNLGIELGQLAAALAALALFWALNRLFKRPKLHERLASAAVMLLGLGWLLLRLFA